MAFPVVSTTSTFGSSSTNTTHTVTLPTGIASGDLIVGLGGVGNNERAAATGYTELADASFSGGFSGYWAAYRIADGTEGATVDVTLAATAQFAAQFFRITSWHGTTPPEISTPATGTSNIPDPGFVSASWSAEDTLWIAVEVNDDRTVTATAYPTNYTSGMSTPALAGGSGASVNVASARRELNIGTEDPDPFSITSSKPWASYTIAVRPGSGGAVPVLRGTLLGVGP